MSWKTAFEIIFMGYGSDDESVQNNICVQKYERSQ